MLGNEKTLTNSALLWRVSFNAGASALLLVVEAIVVAFAASVDEAKGRQVKHLINQ